MPDYEKMYTLLFNAATNAIYSFQKCKPLEAVEILKSAQEKTEEMNMKDED